MIVYHYDPDTRAYLGTSSETDESPLEPGVFLVPANATELVPPSVGNPKTQQAVFTVDAWVVMDIPRPSSVQQNLLDAPKDFLWPRVSVREALKGGV